MDYNSDEIAAREAIANCGKKSVLVMDSTKYGLDLACQDGNVWDFDIVVTGAQLPASVLQICRQHECQVIQV